jgi:hypothetical protein
MLENILSAGREYFGNPHVHNSAEFPDVPIVDCFRGKVMIHESVPMSASSLSRKCIADGIARIGKKYMENPNGNSDNVMKHSKVPLQLSLAFSCLPSTAVRGLLA